MSMEPAENLTSSELLASMVHEFTKWKMAPIGVPQCVHRDGWVYSASQLVNQPGSGNFVITITEVEA